MIFSKHQTVEWWIEQLKEMPPKSVVKLSDGMSRDYMCMLSIYPLDHIANTVVIDIGES